MKKSYLNSAIVARFFVALFFFALLACKKEKTLINLPLSGPNQDFYVLADNNVLAKYNAQNIKTSSGKITLKGLADEEKILTIDFRPATGDLYGISSASKLYIINLSTGQATAVGNAFSPAIAGAVISMDFNPTTDLIRLVSNTGQNLRINPETGTVAGTDTNISGGAIMGIAYTNSFAGASSTELYDIDPTAKVLYKQSGNDGTLTKVADLGLDVGNNVSLDISPDSKNVLMIGQVGNSLNLYSIELGRNLTKLAGIFKDISSARGIAIPTAPVAYATSVDANQVNSLLIFNPGTKATPISKAITGLQSGETLLGIDMRPANGQVFALGSSNRLYTLNLGTAMAMQVGSGTFATPLSGTSFGFDFTAQEDRIRVVSNTGQNLIIHPLTAAVNSQPPLSVTGGTPTVSAAAYTSYVPGSSTAPKLYVIDHVAKKLFTQDPVSGVLTAVGDLKAEISESNGFDIGVSNIGDVAYGIFTVSGKTKLYQVNLSTGLLSTNDNLVEFSQAVTGFTLGRRL